MGSEPEYENWELDDIKMDLGDAGGYEKERKALSMLNPDNKPGDSAKAHKILNLIKKKSEKEAQVGKQKAKVDTAAKDAGWKDAEEVFKFGMSDDIADVVDSDDVWESLPEDLHHPLNNALDILRDNEQGMRNDDDEHLETVRQNLLGMVQDPENWGKKEDTMQQPFFKISYKDSEGRTKSDSMRAKSSKEAVKDFQNMNKGRGFKVVKVQKESIRESKMRRFTVKEVRTWMKTLEENRYKKVYNSDARRVSWMVNHVGESVENMPKSMRKK